MKKNAAPVAPGKLKNPILFLAFGFGSGLLPKAPGTYGTATAIPIFLLIGSLEPLIYFFIVAALTLVGIWLCGSAAKQLGVHDHPGIVWDEIVGFLITMGTGTMSLASIVAGFVLFRIFDIAKPWPIAQIDKQVKGGLGIMMDDVLAGIYAAICLIGFDWLVSAI